MLDMHGIVAQSRERTYIVIPPAVQRITTLRRLEIQRSRIGEIKCVQALGTEIHELQLARLDTIYYEQQLS
jgi:hypothetical protein